MNNVNPKYKDMSGKFDAEALMGDMMDGMPSFLSDSKKELEKEPEKKKEGTKKVKSRKVAMCLSIDESAIDYIKNISKKENVPVSSIVNCGVKMFIDAYEKKHGKISRISTIKRGNAEDLI